jgi:superfamily II DNA or RNA helicase
MNTEPDNQPPTVLELLRQTPSGDIYLLADKEAVRHGLNCCSSPVIDSIAVLEGGRELVVKLSELSSVTVSSSSGELVVTGDGLRRSSRVVSVMAILKRLVTPGSLPHVRFDTRHLDSVALMLGFVPAEPPATAQPSPGMQSPGFASPTAIGSKPTQPQSKQLPPRAYRLVLFQQGDAISGQLRYGETPLYPGMPAPRDLAKFLVQHYFFRASQNYFHDFTSLPGKYPTVMKHPDGSETPLTYHESSPRSAGVAFDLRDGRVTVRRTFDGADQEPTEIRVVGECLFDLASGAIHPFRNIQAWRFMESVRDELQFSEEESGGSHLRLEPGAVSMDALFFSAAAIRANLSGFPSFAESCRFTMDGVPVDPAQTLTPSFFLSIVSDLTGETIRLIPQGEASGVSFPLSQEMFWLLSPAHRSHLSQPLKAKKRVTAMLEGGFAALAATTATGRAQAIRTALPPPDFAKRKIKAEAKEIVQGFLESAGHRMLVLLAAPDGWRFVADDRRGQARLVELLYHFFGLDSFGGEVSFPAELAVPQRELLPRLGELTTALRAAGFDLRFGDTLLQQGEWEFSVEALPTTVNGSIDWFELRPEIRCNGQLLSDEALKALLSGGMLPQGEALILLGDEQRRILELLVAGGVGGKRKRKVESVRIPRLQILDWLELRSHGVTLRLPPQMEELITNLTRLERLPQRPLPAGLHATLRPYQQEGYEWLSFLYEHRFGACLADDMGLGKTVQAISLLAGLAEGQIPSVTPLEQPHLVVVPPSLLFNWENELARFAPGLRVVNYSGTKRSLDFQGVDVVLTSYGILQRDVDKLAEIPFHVIIFDEAQQVKNLQTSTTTAARRLKGEFTLALTGTPMENHLGEYYAIMDLSLPGLLGSYEEFRRKIDIKGFGGIDTLIRRTRPFVLRRTKQMIADELPPRMESDLYLELTPRQRALYQKTVEEVRGTVAEAYQAKAAGQARMIALTAILRLRQICLCPSLFVKGKVESPKLEALADQLLELRDEGHSALVFSQFTGFLDIVEEGLKSKGLECLRLDGSTPVPKRKDLVKSFQESDGPRVFLISLKAGGKGLNLTRATYVYHLDPWWNPAVENQASDRAHRIGQTGQVTVTRLLMRHTVEEKMMSLKERKLKLYKALLEDATGGGGGSLSKADFDFLLGG